MQGGIFVAIELLGKLNEGKTDKETHKDIKQILKAMSEKNRQAWPSKELRKVVNELDQQSKKLFFQTLVDMDDALNEHYEEGAN
jgi:hypothetical protein